MTSERMAELGKLGPQVAPSFHPADDLAILTTYYNPCQYQSRYQNYSLFRRCLEDSKLNLFTIECVFDDQDFELEPGPSVLRVRCRTVLWQKERLLNHAVRSWIPARFGKIAWVDCDLLFTNPDWATETSRLLDQCQVAQVFEFVDRLSRDWRQTGSVGDVARSFGSVLQDPTVVRREGWDAHGHTGYGWAARRSLFESCGLYEACILGNGDHLMAHGFTGESGVFCITKRYPPKSPQLEHYQRWAEEAFAHCRADVRSASGTVFHMWHGDRENRRYLERQDELNAIGYNPYTDIRVDGDGSLAWASDKPGLHALAVAHFSLRKEDG